MRDIFKNSKTKFVILLLVFSFGFTAPFYISSGAGAIAYITKEFGLDLIARAISRKLLTSLSTGIIDSINQLGVEGGRPSAAFVQNWKRFLASAQVIGENQFRAQLNYTIQRGILCDDLIGALFLAFQAGNVPFIDIGNPNKSAELKQNTLTPFQTKMRCTIPDTTRAEFKKDFEKGGGWDTWSRLLEPQNNLSGATLLSIEELQKQRASQEQAHQNETTAGQGFQGVKGACTQAAPAQVQDTVCFKNCYDTAFENDKNMTRAKAVPLCTNQCKGATALGANAQCSFLGDTVTPGKILGEAGANFIDANSKWFVSSDELSEVLLSIVGAAVNKLANFTTKGLVTNATDIIDQIAPDFSNDAQQDRQNLEQIKQNTDEFDVNVTVEAPAQSVEPTPTPTPNALEP